jgi:putative aldouronate transport system permease protein
MLLLLLLPGTLYLLLNNYLPMFGTIIAFKNFNYQKGILGSEWNTVAAIAIAIALNELKNRFMDKFYQSVMFLPYFLSMIVVSYLVLSMLNQEFGYINNGILEPLEFEHISWYSETKYWPYILPVVNLWKNIGYLSVVYLAAIIGIDHEYYEAALIDGASKWQ